MALGTALLLERYNIGGLADPPFLFAIAITVWYAGLGPSILAFVLSLLAVDYFFIPPIHSLDITGADIPHFAMFMLFASLVAWFAAIRRRIDRELLQSRDELQNLNQELAKRSTELESINKELEAFAYSISHDLRAPLRHMAGYTELLQKRASSGLDEKSKHYIRMMLESAKRMGDLIDDLLAFSRIGRAETQKTLRESGAASERSPERSTGRHGGAQHRVEDRHTARLLWGPFDAEACAGQPYFQCGEIYPHAPSGRNRDRINQWRRGVDRVREGQWSGF